MFIKLDNGHLINTNFVKNVKPEGLKLHFYDGNDAILGTKSTDCQHDLERNIESIMINDITRELSCITEEPEKLHNELNIR